MTCKDCCHYDVCCLRILYNMDYDLLNHINTNAEKCEHFKDKSRIIELPYRLGDKVYKIIRGFSFNDHIQEMTIQKFALIAHTDFEIIDQWNLIYSDKLKAEAKLKELEK